MKCLGNTVACLVLLLWVAPILTRGATRYVAPDGEHNAPFESWEDAATNLQSAIDISSGDTTLRVAPGIYTAVGTGTSVVQIVGEKIPAGATFSLVADLPFGAQPGPVILDGQGVNRGIVVNLDAATATRTLNLDGLQIRNGYGDGDGGGIQFATGKAQQLAVNILNCTITNNVAKSGGGGIAVNQFASGQIMWMVVSNSTVSYNEAVTNYGGGIKVLAYNGSLTVRGTTLAYNVATNGSNQSGGGIFFDNYGGLLTVENSSLVGNDSLSSGQQTYASAGGGAICRRNGSATVRNCLIADNIGNLGGAVFLIYFSNYTYLFENCTIVDNQSLGNVIHFRQPVAGSVEFYVYNSIFNGGNTSLFTGNAGSGTPNVGSDLLIDHCNLPINYAGTTTLPGDRVAGSGNITSPPQFFDQAGGDYRLRIGSPSINTGINRDWMVGAVDLDKNPRVDTMFRTVDMGAYEYKFPGTSIIIR